jgi:hypothetical protein
MGVNYIASTDDWDMFATWRVGTKRFFPDILPWESKE